MFQEIRKEEKMGALNADPYCSISSSMGFKHSRSGLVVPRTK